jgi:hypothetical protein
MKNKIYIFGVVNVILILIGCVFKVQHWLAGGIIITLSLTSFALILIPIALINSYRSETDKKLALYIFAYICILITCASFLFKIQHWPGAGYLMVIAIPLPFVLFLPAYILDLRKTKNLNYTNVVIVLFFFAYFGAFTALLALNVSKNIIIEIVESAISLEKKVALVNDQSLAIMESLPIKNATDSIKKANMLKIKEKADEITTMIDQFKVAIINQVDHNSAESEVSSDKINLWQIRAMESGYFSDESITKTQELKRLIDNYRDLLLSFVNPKEAETVEFINHQLDTKDYCGDLFNGMRVISLMEYLNLIKSKNSLAALETVSAIANN